LNKKLVHILMENTQMTTKEVSWDEFLKIADAEKEEQEETAAPAPKKTRRSPAPKTKKEKSE